MKLLDFVHAVLFAFLAVVHVRNWIRRGFWFPRYIHVLAAITFCFSVWMIWFLQQPQYMQPGAKPSPMRYVIVLLLPAIVYTVFVVYGGTEEASEPKKDTMEEPRQLEQGNPFSNLKS